MIAAGADGCRGGWVVALHDGSGFEIFVAGDFPTVRRRAAGASALGVDIPVQLFDDFSPRACDREARRLLGRRASTVFPAPPRPLLGCRTHAQALAASRRQYGRGLSAQCFHLFPKIREVQGIGGILEIHPELAFLAMNGGGALPGKKTADGRALREALLPTVPGGRWAGARRDDVLDAAAVAWSAWRHSRGEAVRLGDDRAAIWY